MSPILVRLNEKIDSIEYIHTSQFKHFLSSQFNLEDIYFTYQVVLRLVRINRVFH